jgi:uncharacterized membrane protein
MSSRHVQPGVPIFEALIVPYRSMTARGVAVVGVSVAALSAAVSLRFLLLGAWPVLLFSVLEVPLVSLLLAINLRRARASELILLDRQTMTVTRTDPRGRRQSFSMPAAWLQVKLEAAASGSRIIVANRGCAREVGAFLHETDRSSLFEALSRAMHDVRNPSFDNPQLREP